MADMVSRSLEKVLNVSSLEEDVTDENKSIIKQPEDYNELISEKDIQYYNEVKNGVGIEDFAKMVLMKSASKAMSDHDELIDIMSKVDDSKAARMAEVAQTALSNAQDAAKALVSFDLTKQKMEIEKSKIEIKNLTIQNNSGDGMLMGGSQKDILEKLKNIMTDEEDDDPADIIPVE